MTRQPGSGISRRGLDSAFATDETRKSSRILEARQLRDRGEDQLAAELFAAAAEIEERLSEACAQRGLAEKAAVHGFGAASCWARAGNFYRALVLCEALLLREIAPPMRDRIRQSAGALRDRRARWSVELATHSPGG